MATPRIESIALDIETAIGEITTANGYNQDLTALRPRRNDFNDVTPENNLVLITQSDASAFDDHAIGVARYQQSFVLIAFVIDSDSATDSIDTRINKVRSDIEKKLMVDPQRGTYANDTMPIGASVFDDGEGFSGVAVQILVDYQTELTDPYTAA